MNITLEEAMSDRNKKMCSYFKNGLSSIPLILDDLQNNDFGWQHIILLRSLTKHTKYDPGNLPNEAKGDFEKMKVFWLEWAKKHQAIFEN